MSSDSAKVESTVTTEATPELLARLFWNMDSRQQADFYAALGRVAGDDLCMQTAWIVSEIATRHARGDSAAREAFGVLHSHADEYLPVYVDQLIRKSAALAKAPTP